MNTRLHLIPLLLLPLFVAACGDGAAPADTKATSTSNPKVQRVVVANAPLAWAVEGMAPKGTKVEVLAPDTGTARGVELTKAQRTSITNADAVVYVGGDYQPEVAELVHAAADVESVDVLGALKLEQASDAFWMDPILLRGAVDYVAAELGWNPGDVDGDLRQLQADVETKLRSCTVRTISSPTEGVAYFADRFLLELAPTAVAVTLDPLDDVRDASDSYLDRQLANADTVAAALGCPAGADRAPEDLGRS